VARSFQRSDETHAVTMWAWMSPRRVTEGEPEAKRQKL
jgi:hypothetical protein